MLFQKKIHTHPMEGHRKFQGGGDLTRQNLEAKYEAKPVSIKCRLQTGYKMQTRYKMQTADCRLQTGYKMQTETKTVSSSNIGCIFEFFNLTYTSVNCLSRSFSMKLTFLYILFEKCQP